MLSKLIDNILFNALLAFNMNTLKDGLVIAVLGLGGVFLVIILLYIITKILGSFTNKKE